MRIGQSTDIHRLEDGRKLILGGVEIPYEKGLLGHSDADALLHAIAEAILGALALGDLGTHFKDTDPKWKGVSSLIILEGVYLMMKEKGYRIGNVDSLILIEEPKMKPYIPLMVENVARVLHCDQTQISIKATRGEGLGFVGLKQGVMAQAVVLLEEDESCQKQN